MTYIAPPTTSSAVASIRPHSLRADFLSAYVLTFCRVGAWAGVSALVFRGPNPSHFALLALLRGTITLVSYASLGLGPSMVRFLSRADAEKGPTPQVIMASGLRLSQRLLLAIVLLLGLTYLPNLQGIHRLSNDVVRAATHLGIFFVAGAILRLFSEPMSAAIQTRGRLAFDNYAVAACEIAWLSIVVIVRPWQVEAVGAAWLGSSLLLLILRILLSRSAAPDLKLRTAGANWLVQRQLLRFGGMIALAYMADFLYAPTDYILISRFLGVEQISDYAPAVQIDGALLLLIATPALVFYPHVAAAHATGNIKHVRRLYILGTLGSLLLLSLAAIASYLLAPFIFRVWLNDPMPGTMKILPLVLVHTVVGGSSAIGRSVLLGLGKTKAVTISVLVAGTANVVLSALFASTFKMGLPGIVLGTVVVVVARCAIWMPWYVLRSLPAK